MNIPVELRRSKNSKEMIEGVITDISVGGAFIETQAKIDPTQELVIEIKFDEIRVFEVRVTEKIGALPKQNPAEKSVVRWSREDEARPGFGIEFTDLHDDTRVFLEMLVAYYEKLAKAGVSF